MTLSNKADHKKLPKPQVPRFSAGTGYVPPKTENERVLSAALCARAADRARVDRASFLRRPRRELAADGALLRGDPQELRACRTCRCATSTSTRPSRGSARISMHRSTASSRAQPEPFHVPSNLSYYTCGAMQLAFYAAYALFGLWVLDAGYNWATAADGALALYARSVVFAAGSFVALTAISIVAKWAADRPLQGAVDPDLELCVFPLLGRDDHDAHYAGDGIHRHADLQHLSAPDGRADRPQRRHRQPPRRRSAPTC